METRHASLGNYQIIKTLGSGGTSKVKLGYDVSNNHYVAIKIIKPTYASQRREEVEKELDILSSLKHPNIINLIDVQENAKYIKKNGTSQEVIAFILEFAPSGDLFEYIASTGPFSEETARTLFKALVETIQYCHTAGIAHRDLKPENILLDENFNVKLTDFGFATLVCGKDHDDKLYTCNGTELYMAPEMHVGDAYNGTAVDIFSLGVILFVMISGHPPFCKADPRCDNFYKCFCLSKYKIFWSQHERTKPKQANKVFYSPEFRSLINGMISADPSERLTIEQIKEHQWYNGPTISAAKLQNEFAQRKKIVDQELQKRRDEKKKEKERTSKLSAAQKNSQRHYSGIKPY